MKRGDLDAVLAVLPALNSPTISQLSDSEWVAVNTILEERVARDAVTGADAQAFKRACSCFGLGRYLYRFGETRVRLNGRGEPVAIPALPEWALPPGITMAQANALPGDMRGPVDQRLTAEIEGFQQYNVERLTQEPSRLDLLFLPLWFLAPVLAANAALFGLIFGAGGRGADGVGR